MFVQYIKVVSPSAVTWVFFVYFPGHTRIRSKITMCYFRARSVKKLDPNDAHLASNVELLSVFTRGIYGADVTGSTRVRCV